MSNKKYALKDKERQKALEAALPGFANEFQSACKEFFSKNNGIEINFVSSKNWCVCFERGEIEEIPTTYNPKEWNSFPEVMPPEGVIMCVEAQNDRGLWRCSAIFDQGCWMFYKGMNIRSRDVKRFRAWE